MKILCIADIHGHLDGIVKTRDYLIRKGIHSVVLMGDFSAGVKGFSQNKVDVEYALGELKENAMVLAVPGNCDDPEIVGVLAEHNVNLHERKVEVDGVCFVGLGGSNPTPLGTPFEMPEEVIYDKLKKLTARVKKKKLVLVTHFPPKDTGCDLIPNVGHVGSTSLRRIIEEKKPALCVCSHIHEAAGVDDVIGETRVVNVGPLSHGNAVEIETDGLSAVHVEVE